VTINQLDNWLSKCQSQEKLNVQHYLDEYKVKSAQCLIAGTISKGHRGFYLTKGLPTYWRDKLLDNLKLDPEKQKDFHYEEISEYISTRVEQKAAGKRILTSYQKPAESSAILWTKPRTASEGPTQLFQPAGPPTQAEVDDLVSKYANLQLQGIHLASATWSNREQQLLENKEVAMHVQREGANRHQNNQKPYAFLQNFSAPPNTSQNQPQYNSSQQQRTPNATRKCFVCDSLSHVQSNCPTVQQLTENGWIHANENGFLKWGRLDRPGGAIRELSGAQSGWKDIICAQIKTRWLHADQNPLTTPANWDEIQARQQQQAQTNSIGAVAQIDNLSGVITQEEYDNFWQNNVVGNNDSEPEVNAAAIAKPQRATKPIFHRPAGDVQVTKPQREETTEKHIIQPRGSRLKHPEDFHADEPMPERKTPLHPKPTQEMLKEAMRQMPVQPKETVPRGPQKPRFVDLLQPTTSQQINALMSSPVTVTVEDILQNMPEVQKYMFKHPMTVHNTSAIELYTDSEDEDEPRITLASVNGMATESIPDYVIVDATAQGQVTRCASVAADH
jgi:hypothetical protein